MDKITALIKHYEKDMLADLSKLIAIPSIRDLDTKKEGAPFPKRKACISGAPGGDASPARPPRA